MNRNADSNPTSDHESVQAEVRLLKHAVPEGGGRVPFLLRLQGRLPEREDARTPIDLALVLDRSGSMGGEPIEAAKVAAHDAVDLLEDGDRIAIVAYANDVHVLVPPTGVHDRRALHRLIERIHAGGGTALHDGWVEGAQQLVDLLGPARTARVVLLTDGLANIGVTDPARIAADVAKLAAHGVVTSAIGLGRYFNEDLLASVADAGGGRFAHAEAPAELEGVMAAELIGIDATVARRVRARFHADGVAAEVADVLNDFPALDGGLALPDVVAGLSLDVAGVLHVRPSKPHLDRQLGTVELSWTDAGGERRTASLSIAARTLPAAEYDAAETDPDVAAAVAVLTAARHREAAMRAIDRGDDRTVERQLEAAERLVAGAPDTERVRRESTALGRVREAHRMHDIGMMRKRFAAQRSMSRKSFDADALSMTAHFTTKQEALRARRAAREDAYGAPASGESIDVARADGSVATLRLRTGDITEWAGDAIVNPTNPHLHGSGASVDGAVHRRGGMELTRECRDLGHVGIGRAVVTKGWDLPAGYVLHTAVPVFDGSDQAFAALASCYRATLELAAQLRLRRVAFPAIGTGTNGFPSGRAAEVALREIAGALAHPDAPSEVDVVLHDRRMHAVFRRALERAQDPSQRRPRPDRRSASAR